MYHSIHLVPSTSLHSTELKKIFKLVDADRSGFIEPSELEMVMNEAGLRLSRREINKMVTDADVLVRDGKISFDECVIFLF